MGLTSGIFVLRVPTLISDDLFSARWIDWHPPAAISISHLESAFVQRLSCGSEHNTTIMKREHELPYMPITNILIHYDNLIHHTYNVLEVLLHIVGDYNL